MTDLPNLWNLVLLNMKTTAHSFIILLYIIIYCKLTYPGPVKTEYCPLLLRAPKTYVYNNSITKLISFKKFSIFLGPEHLTVMKSYILTC